MYGGGVVAGATTTTAGVLALPNTGASVWLTVVSISAIVVGVSILITTGARLVAKKLYKA